MAFLLDTNIAIHARDGHPGVLDQLERHDDGAILSALTLAELRRGVFRLDHADRQLRASRLSVLLEYLPIAPFDQAAADAYGEIIAHCGWVRARDFDRMIAGHAISISAALVTNNTADFRDIPGLDLVDWV